MYNKYRAEGLFLQMHFQIDLVWTPFLVRLGKLRHFFAEIDQNYVKSLQCSFVAANKKEGEHFLILLREAAKKVNLFF